MEPLLRLTEEEYLVIEEAIAANARGRAFLRMRDQRARAFSADEAIKALKDYLSEMKIAAPVQAVADPNLHVRILRQELQEMSVYIQQTRSEIAALRPDDAGNNRIMAASGELDAIVLATERATSDILNSAEKVSALVAKIPREDPAVASVANEIDQQVIEILTACSFQDITGQRITKVVATLHYLEKRVNSMIGIWSVDGSVSPAAPHPDDIDKRPDAHLLNGPSDDGVSQDDVDALLSGLNGISQLEAPPPVKEAAPPPKAAPAPAPAKAAPAPAPEPAPKKAKEKPSEKPAEKAAEKVASAAAPAPAPAPAPAAAKPAPAAPPKEAPPPPSGVQVNQSDIDALFD